MLKELDVVNGAHVNSGHSMPINHRLDAPLLVQTQWSPLAIELVLTGVEKLRTADPGAY
jgi:hypothetical protein